MNACSINSSIRPKYPLANVVDFLLHQVEAERDQNCTLPLINGRRLTDDFNLLLEMWAESKHLIGEQVSQIKSMLMDLCDEAPQVIFVRTDSGKFLVTVLMLPWLLNRWL